MSTENILSMIPVQGGVVVVFRVHGAEGQRSYFYGEPDASAIMSGSDPANYTGERDGGGGAFGEAAEIATDIAEIGML